MNYDDFNSNNYNGEPNYNMPAPSAYQPPAAIPPAYQPAPIPMAKKKAGGGVALAIACILLGAVAGVGGAMFYQSITTPQPQILYTTPQLQAEKVVNYSTDGISLPDLYNMNVNSSVGITVSTTRNVFGQPTTSAAAGSGFVISEDGYVVTNHHVVEEAVGDSNNPVEVTFKNGDKYEAEIVGFDKDHDLAVLKINATGLAPVVFGDSDALVVGETVVAIGNPLGELDFSFTDGIISAKDRLISTGDGSTMNMLQTNAAINPGNSGGPLFDGSGALVGINTAKYTNASDGTTVEGLGFAIPINDVKEIIPDLIANGYITGKPYLGITVSNVPEEAQLYGITAGASVESVAPGGAAEKAGLQRGDIITAIDGTSVDTFSALTAAMNDYKAGDTATLTVQRNRDEVTLKVTFDEKNEATEEVNWDNSPNAQSKNEVPDQSGSNSGFSSDFPFGYLFP